MRMRMVLIPTWVEQALTAAKKPLVTCLDVCELSDTLSKEDVAFYMVLNDVLVEKQFKPLAESFVPYQLYPYQNSDGNPEFKAFQEYLTRKTQEIRTLNVNMDPYQLVSNSGYEIPPNEKFEAVYTFEPVYLKDDIIGIRPLVRRSDEDDVKEDIYSYDELMKLLSTFLPLEEIAPSAAFKHYTRLLRAAA